MTTIEDFDPSPGMKLGSYKGVNYAVKKKGSVWHIHAFDRMFTWESSKLRAISLFKDIIDRGFYKNA